jgi:hypothetical protein
MRRLWITDRPYPADAATIAAAAAAGATEIVHGVPPTLAALGIDTLGLHQLPDPEPAPDPRAALLDRISQATMLDEIREIVADAIGGGVL